MSSNLTHHDKISGDFVLKFAESCLRSDEIRSSGEDIKMNGARYDRDISTLLQQLPKVKACKNFERKMAARFALELHEEVVSRNRENIARSSIPG